MITWDKIVKAVAGAAGAVWGLFGGRDTMLTVMLALMAIDYITGLVIGWVGKSPKTDSGHLSSAVGWAGLAKKAGELLAVIVGVLLDMLAVEQLGYQGAVFRTGMMLYIIATEGISVLENLGLLGVPLPGFVRKALEQLQQQSGEGSGGTPEN